MKKLLLFAVIGISLFIPTDEHSKAYAVIQCQQQNADGSTTPIDCDNAGTSTLVSFAMLIAGTGILAGAFVLGGGGILTGAAGSMLNFSDLGINASRGIKSTEQFGNQISKQGKSFIENNEYSKGLKETASNIRTNALAKGGESAIAAAEKLRKEGKPVSGGLLGLIGKGAQKLSQPPGLRGKDFLQRNRESYNQASSEHAKQEESFKRQAANLGIDFNEIDQGTGRLKYYQYDEDGNPTYIDTAKVQTAVGEKKDSLESFARSEGFTNIADKIARNERLTSQEEESLKSRMTPEAAERIRQAIQFAEENNDDAGKDILEERLKKLQMAMSVDNYDNHIDLHRDLQDMVEALRDAQKALEKVTSGFWAEQNRKLGEYGSAPKSDYEIESKARKEAELAKANAISKLVAMVRDYKGDGATDQDIEALFDKIGEVILLDNQSSPGMTDASFYTPEQIRAMLSREKDITPEMKATLEKIMNKMETDDAWHTRFLQVRDRAFEAQGWKGMGEQANLFSQANTRREIYETDQNGNKVLVRVEYNVGLQDLETGQFIDAGRRQAVSMAALLARTSKSESDAITGQHAELFRNQSLEKFFDGLANADNWNFHEMADIMGISKKDSEGNNVWKDKFVDSGLKLRELINKAQNGDISTLSAGEQQEYQTARQGLFRAMQYGTEEGRRIDLSVKKGDFLNLDVQGLMNDGDIDDNFKDAIKAQLQIAANRRNTDINSIKWGDLSFQEVGKIGQVMDSMQQETLPDGGNLGFEKLIQYGRGIKLSASGGNNRKIDDLVGKLVKYQVNEKAGQQNVAKERLLSDHKYLKRPEPVTAKQIADQAAEEEKEKEKEARYREKQRKQTTTAQTPPLPNAASATASHFSSLHNEADDAHNYAQKYNDPSIDQATRDTRQAMVNGLQGIAQAIESIANSTSPDQSQLVDQMQRLFNQKDASGNITQQGLLQQANIEGQIKANPQLTADLIATAMRIPGLGSDEQQTINEYLFALSKQPGGNETVSKMLMQQLAQAQATGNNPEDTAATNYLKSTTLTPEESAQTRMGMLNAAIKGDVKVDNFAEMAQLMYLMQPPDTSTPGGKLLQQQVYGQVIDRGGISGTQALAALAVNDAENPLAALESVGVDDKLALMSVEDHFSFLQQLGRNTGPEKMNETLSQPDTLQYLGKIAAGSQQKAQQTINIVNQYSVNTNSDGYKNIQVMAGQAPSNVPDNNLNIIPEDAEVMRR